MAGSLDIELLEVGKPLAKQLSSFPEEPVAGAAEGRQHRAGERGNVFGPEGPVAKRGNLYREEGLGIGHGLGDASRDRLLDQLPPAAPWQPGHDAEEVSDGLLLLASPVSSEGRSDLVVEGSAAGYGEEIWLQQRKGANELGGVQGQLRPDEASVGMADDVRPLDAQIGPGARPRLWPGRRR